MLAAIPGRFGNSIDFNDENKLVLVDFDSFNGDGYVSSFFELQRITVAKWLKSITCWFTFSPDTSSVEYG